MFALQFFIYIFRAFVVFERDATKYSLSALKDQRENSVEKFFFIN